MKKVKVCVDVMGGDEEPQVVLDGIDAALAADADIEVIAVGPEELVVPFAEKRDRVEPLVAPQVITMEDDPLKAVMSKRKSSIVVACRAVKKGVADGFFSAGATGAVTAAATAYVTPLGSWRVTSADPFAPASPRLFLIVRVVLLCSVTWARTPMLIRAIWCVLARWARLTPGWSVALQGRAWACFLTVRKTPRARISPSRALLP